MSTIDELLEIEKLEKKLAQGERPQEVFSMWKPSVNGGVNYTIGLAHTFQVYLRLADAHYQAVSPKVLVDAFRAAVRHSRVNQDQVGRLYILAQVEANQAREEAASTSLYAEGLEQRGHEKDDELNNAEGRIADLEAEVQSLRGKYARSVQTINRLQAKLSAPSSDPTT